MDEILNLIESVSEGFPSYFLRLCLFMVSLFPRDVSDEILDLIESVSEGFPTFSLYTPVEDGLYYVMRPSVRPSIG